MPLYDYRCPACEARRECLQKHTDPAPACACGATMRRQVSRTSFALKGHGWAKDGYTTRPPGDVPRATKD